MEAFDGTNKQSQNTQEVITYMEEGKLHERQIEETRQKLQEAIDALQREFAAGQGLILMYVNIGWQGNDLSVQEQQGQLVNMDKEQLRQGLATLGLTVNQDGVLEVGEIKTQTIEVKNPYGITIYDTVTGQPQCVISQNGQLRTVAGKCDGLVASPPTENLISLNSPQGEEPVVEEEAPIEEEPVVEEPGNQVSPEGNLVSDPQVEEPVIEEPVVQEPQPEAGPPPAEVVEELIEPEGSSEPEQPVVADSTDSTGSLQASSPQEEPIVEEPPVVEEEAPVEEETVVEESVPVS